MEKPLRITITLHPIPYAELTAQTPAQQHQPKPSTLNAVRAAARAFRPL